MNGYYETMTKGDSPIDWQNKNYSSTLKTLPIIIMTDKKNDVYFITLCLYNRVVIYVGGKRNIVSQVDRLEQLNYAQLLNSARNNIHLYSLGNRSLVPCSTIMMLYLPLSYWLLLLQLVVCPELIVIVMCWCWNVRFGLICYCWGLGYWEILWLLDSQFCGG